MRDIFAEMRVFFAYTDLERLNLGALVHQFIRKDILPQVRKSLAQAKTDTDREFLTRLVEEYEKYSDPSTQESKIYDKTAANIVRTLAQRSRLGDEEMEDLMMQLAEDFLKPASGGGGNYLKTGLERLFKKQANQSPLELNKLWASIVDLRTRWRIRENHRHHQEQTFDYRQNDDGEEVDPISQIPAPPQEYDESYKKQIMIELVAYMHRKLTRPEMRVMFDRWFKLAGEKGGDAIDMKHDIMPYLHDKGYDAPYPTMMTWWSEIKRTIVNFFEKERDGELAILVKKMLRVSAAEVLTYETYRRKLAAWMLGGIMMGTLRAGE